MQTSSRYRGTIAEALLISTPMPGFRSQLCQRRLLNTVILELLLLE